MALLFLGFGVTAFAHADDGGDAGVSLPAPDASVGEGGADRDNEEGEDGVGRVVIKCRTSSECSPRFTCTEGRCQYTGIREAERVGCLLGPEAAVMLVGVGLLASWRRRSR
jgi:MYXO-CTERM domain-containing protein